MRFDYFYEEQSESYAFYKIPKMLFTEEMFETLSTDARVLYGLLLDRVSLSKRNSWIDDEGKVYIYFTINNVKAAMRCANTKACALMKELQDFGLIERKKQGLGKPALIYVKDFTRFRKPEFMGSENQKSGEPQIRIMDCRKSESINTESYQNEFSDTHSILSEEEEERRGYTEYFREQLQLDCLIHDHPYDKDMIMEIFDLIVDTVCTKKDIIRVAGDNKPAGVVKSQLMKLDQGHIEFVLGGMKENTTQVRCIKQYLLAALYNAPLTISNYYQSLVNHDMATGKV